MFTENVAVAEILGRIPSDLAGVPLWSKDSRPGAWNGVKCKESTNCQISLGDFSCSGTRCRYRRNYVPISVQAGRSPHV